MVPVVLCLAGILFSTTAETSRGFQLRSDRRLQLNELIGQRRGEVERADRRAAQLRDDLERKTRQKGTSDDEVGQEETRGRGSEAGAGFTAVHGRGLRVRLDDAPRRADRRLPNGATVDDLVVHQQDVQAVVNALWAGGAEAMAIMNVRVISTSAVRCVGNTLLLHGRVYSPPFEIVAIGPPSGMLEALERAPGVRAYRAAVADFGLGYQVKTEEDLKVPAYDGPDELTRARVTP